MITETFGEKLMTTINTPKDNPVHVLFNQWWAHAPEDVKQDYVEMFLADEARHEWYRASEYAEPLDLDALGALGTGTFGAAYRDWIVDNDLAEQIALDYRAFHESLEASGALDGMPDEMRFAVLRGFQVHDLLHVLSGYDSSGLGEIALQAFSLAQLQFPYFGMWMSVVTAQMTYLRPQSIVPLMDAITDGWTYGRTVAPNLMTQPLESMLPRQLADVRHDFGIELSPMAIRQQARR